MSLSIVLAGGGSAGHVSPLLATADALRRLDPQTRITVLGTAEGLEARLVPARGYSLTTIPKVPLPRRLNADLARLPLKLRSTVARTLQVLRESRADVVVGMGGYVSTPAYLAARRLGIPIVIHEQNARPGLANRLGARFTRHVTTAFDGSGLPHATRIGMPLRHEITDLANTPALDRVVARAEARRELGLSPDVLTLLVTGGSLGAQRINEAMAQAMPELPGPAGGDNALPVQVLHLTGAGKADAVNAAVQQAAAGDPRIGRLYQVREYLDRMETAYAAADLVLCRSGANTVCELTCVGLPAVYVPLAVGNGEQRLNAEPVVAAGGGLMIDNSAVDGDAIRDQVLPLLRDPLRLAQMGEAAVAFGTRDADTRLAELVVAAARAGGRNG